MNSEKIISKYSPACLILSGGKSGRFPNHQKALLPFSSGTTFIEHIISVYQEAGIQKIQVVIQPEIKLPDHIYQLKEISVCLNPQPDLGRIYSIKCGLENLQNERFCFIQNADSPFIDCTTLLDLMKHCADADYVVPSFEGKRGHPVLISNKIKDYILQIKNYDQTLRDVLSNFGKSEVAVKQSGILININTPEDYNRYFSKKIEP